LRERYEGWLKRRLPPAPRVVLKQRRLFIFPSRPGFFFLGTLLLMLLTAINYQNNLIYALTFWLGMLFVIAIHYTHGNLLGLEITGLGAGAVFPGQRAEFELQFDGRGRRSGHHSVAVSWPDSETMVDVPPGGSIRVRVFHPVSGRGWYRPPRLRIQSTYPLGLLRCWTFVDLDLKVLVYPAPLRIDSLPAAGGDSHEGLRDEAGFDDLAGFRDYAAGDSLRHLDWRSWARGGELQTRVYANPTGDSRWLDWDAFSAGSVEQRLSWLCWLTLQYHARGQEYGLRLPGQEIPPASGDAHRDAVLRALALYAPATGERA